MKDNEERISTAASQKERIREKTSPNLMFLKRMGNTSSGTIADFRLI